MHPGLKIGAVVGMLLVGFAIWACSQVTFLYRHPQAPDVRIVMDYRTNTAVVADRAKAAAVALAKLPPAAAPRAVAAETTYNFGTMNPLAEGQHQFAIRNEGTAPLKLNVGPTTCKCTVSGVEKRELAPGEETFVTMDWNTGRDTIYSHSATIYTNDPEQKALYFTVEGAVRVEIAAEPKQLDIPAGSPTTKTIAEVFLHSQLWPDFELVSAKLDAPDFTWSLEDVVPEQAPKLQAIAVKKLHLEFSGPVAKGDYQRDLELELRPRDSEAEPTRLVVPVTGAVQGRLAFYGPDIDAEGIIDLGNINLGSARQSQVVLKIRDEQRELENVKLTVTPDFLVAKFEPLEGGKLGMYQLTLEVPAGIAPCQYRGQPLGKVRVETTHPRVGAFELGVSFAILPKRS